MLKIGLGLLSLAIFTVDTHADINPDQFLMEQVIWGETYHRDDVVKSSLDRLQLIAPDSPDVIAAQIRLAIHEKKIPIAEKLLEKLKQKAPDSLAFRQAKMNLALVQPAIQQQLQQARVLAMSGRTALAIAQYDALFHGDFPTSELSTEYWTLVSKLPDQKENALNHLQTIYNFLDSNHIYPNKTKGENWSDGLKVTLSNLLSTKGGKAFKTNNLDLAQKYFQQAILLEQKNYFAWMGIGDVAFAKKNYAEAESAYKHAYAINPELPNAVYGLIPIYKHQSLQNASHYLDSLPTDQKIKFQEAKQRLDSEILQAQAEGLGRSNQWAKAVEKYSAALKLDSDNIWLTYHLATALNHLGKPKKANDLFQQFMAKHKRNPEEIYAYATYLANSDQMQKALNALKTIPVKQWNSKMHQLSQRLTTTLVLQQAQSLYDSGNKQAAIDYLQRQTPTTEIKLKLADWAFNAAQYASALKYYQDVKSHEPLNATANLGIIDSLIALGDKKQAKQLLIQMEKQNIVFKLDMQRRIANDWNALGEPQKALSIFNRLKEKYAHAAPSQESAWLFRDAARLEAQLHLAKIAQEDYKKAMVQSKITSTYPTNNNTYTFLTRSHADDDWLKRSIRSGAGSLYQQQETHVTVDEDYWVLSGTPGTSQLNAEDTITQADWGLYGGRAFVRADKVNLNAGNFATVNGIYFSDFGTCNIVGCSTYITQRARGVSWDGGWQSTRWGMDIGQTPVGFPVVNWIGGVNYSGSLQNIGWTIVASQRPMTNSLLSFAGAVDPNTGIVWGGVVARGLTLALSYDRGEAHGFWANIIGSQLVGQNVETNKRLLLLDGYYYKIINEDDRRFSVGLTNMVWHYEKNLFGYHLGQGGYYSPDFYLSFTVPIDYRKRTANWSYELGGTASWSYASTQNLANYPLPNLIPNLINNSQNLIQTGGPSTGYGYSIFGLVDRRLSSHFILGALANYQHSTDYTPSHLSIYLRYSLEGWEGDMTSPIVPLIPYSNFR